MEKARLSDRIVLVVEDEPLVRLELVETLSSCGAHVLSACRVADAIKSIDLHKIAAALLDINLGGEDCSVLCEHLSQRKIPFAFYTGYVAAPDGWRDVPIITKPARRTQIVNSSNACADCINKQREQ